MSKTLPLRSTDRGDTTPAVTETGATKPGTAETGITETAPTGPLGNADEIRTESGNADHTRRDDSSADDTTAAVLPTPLHAVGAAAVGGLAGLGAVYLVATRLAGTLAAVAAIVLIFAVTMAGPRVHARAGTEVGRVIAVALQAVGFGGALAALAVMT